MACCGLDAGRLHRIRMWSMMKGRRREWFAAAVLSSTAIIAALLAQNPQTLQLLSGSAGG